MTFKWAVDQFDLLIVGGGINGTAIARDAALRGAEVLLVEKDDLAAHTSSASSKLIHGGLRYLEYYEFRLVREALREREIMLRTAPHIVQPLQFALPHCRGMRPFWMVRAGLLLYDLLSLKGGLPRSRRLWRGEDALRAPLQERRRLLSYWDARVDDSRLTVLNAVAAADQGAGIATRTELLSARREGELWIAELSGGRTVAARAIVNAAGPWVADVLRGRLSETSESRVRLVKGSHILVPQLYAGDHAYILQQPDGRVVFAIPYGGGTLIGTTDIPAERPEDAVIDPEEIRYLCEAADRYFRKQVVPADVIWSYSGVRALHDDGAAEARAVTRDYHLELDSDPGGKLLSVFGGKITTSRALAEEAVDLLGIEGASPTARMPLPGGDRDPDFDKWRVGLFTWLPAPILHRMLCAYGTRLYDVVGGAESLAELGRHFGSGLYEAEVNYLIREEFAQTAEDILWRRSKLGLHMQPKEVEALERWIADRPGGKRVGRTKKQGET